ncbi:MAG: YceD family protein [Pseudomonadota bacterium]
MPDASELGAAYVVSLERLEADSMALSIETTPDQRAAIAQRLRIPGVDALEGEARLQKSGPLVRVEGRIKASLKRQCVVTLEPAREEIEAPFETLLTTDPVESEEEELDLDADVPEPIEGDAVDAGDLFIQYLALVMAEHPRKDGAEFEPVLTKPEALSPFSVLKSD